MLFHVTTAGAALATLAATACAISNDIEKTVYLITFGCPHVGKLRFVQNFRVLEDLQKVGHIRITNDEDIVPRGMAMFGYIHTASVHLNLFGERFNPFGGDKWFHLSAPSVEEVSDAKLMVKFISKPAWLLGNPSHALRKYKKRLDRAKKDLELLTVDDLLMSRI